MFHRVPATVAALLAALAHVASGFGPGHPTTPPVTARASVSDSVIHVAGKPFFPIMLIDQCSAAQARQADRLGVNLILNEDCGSLAPKRQLSLIQPHVLAVLPIQARGTRGGGLVGWTYPDEPEDNAWTPATLARAHPYARGNSDGLLSFVTTGGGFFRAPFRAPSIARSAYGGFAHLADVAGFDLYPLGHCSSDLSAVHDAQKQFVRLAGSTPTFQWIETGPLRPTYCGGFTMTPAELDAEVWLAITGGARGIGYFTHTWTPEHHAFDVSPELVREIRRLDGILAAVTPGLVGDTVSSGSDSGAVEVLARTGAGRTYVFAVNSSQTVQTVKLHVPALRHAPVTVLGERRSIVANDGRFSDVFQPLAVHLYVQPAH